MQRTFRSKERLKPAWVFPDARRDALREFGPGVCAGHAGRMPGLRGAPDRCVSTAVAAPLDRHAGQELQVAYAKGLHGLPCHRRDVSLAGPGKRNSLQLCPFPPSATGATNSPAPSRNQNFLLSFSLFPLSLVLMT